VGEQRSGGRVPYGGGARRALFTLSRSCRAALYPPHLLEQRSMSLIPVLSVNAFVPADFVVRVSL